MEKSICYLGGIRYNFFGLFGSRQKLLLAGSGDSDQMPHCVASDLGLHCLPRLGEVDGLTEAPVMELLVVCGSSGMSFIM